MELITYTGIATLDVVMMINDIIHPTEIEGAPKFNNIIYRRAQEGLVSVPTTQFIGNMALVLVLFAPHESRVRFCPRLRLFYLEGYSRVLYLSYS